VERSAGVHPFQVPRRLVVEIEIGRPLDQPGHPRSRQIWRITSRGSSAVTPLTNRHARLDDAAFLPGDGRQGVAQLPGCGRS